MARKKKISKKEAKRKMAVYVFILLIIVAIVLGSKFGKLERLKNENQNITNTNKAQNAIDNKTDENKVDSKNTVDTSTTPQVQSGPSSEEKTAESINKEKSDKEKAIEYAKQNWGEDDTVYFTIDDNNPKDENGDYIVYIRDVNTTHEVERCKVDVETGACTY